METENQQAGYGRSRGKWNRKKQKERLAQKESRKPEDLSKQQSALGGPQGQNPEQKNNGKTVAVIAGTAILAVVIVAGAVYAVLGQKYKRVYFPNTTINGLDVSGLTPEETKDRITAETSGYTLTLQERGEKNEVINGSDIGFHPEFDGTLEQILEDQSVLAWGFHIGRYVDYTIDTMAVFDETKLFEVVSGLACLSPEQVVEPQNAYISDYISGTGYEIVPEEEGASPDMELLSSAVHEAILNFQETLSLEDAGVYKKPQITAEDEALNAELAAWNKYVQTRITYRFGSKSEILDGEKIHTWLVSDGQGGVSLDETKIAEYVSWLAQNYNTAYKPKTFQTSYGQSVTISKSVYGWKINQSEETAALKQLLLSCESQEREPVYSQTAASHDGNDYGTTYAEINLTAQHMFFYKEGKLVVQSDFVSGNESRGWSTPAGVYPLTYKQRNATLKGENYSTPVSYWMPFNGGIGMHDAYWRSSFGGKIYKTNGSHGCINLPPAVAKTVYENISAGMPVICYHLDGTGDGKTSTAAQNGTEGSTQPTTAAQTPAETKPQQTEGGQAAETKPQSQSGGNGQSSPHESSTQPTSAAQTQPGTASQPQSTSAAAQPTTAAQAQPGGAAQPTTAASQQQPSNNAAGSGGAQAYPGQNGASQNTPSGNSQSGLGSSSGGTQSTPGASGNTPAGPGSTPGTGTGASPSPAQIPGPGGQ